MRRRLLDLIIGTTPIVTAVIGYILALAAATDHTVCQGAPASGSNCDTHAGRWAIVGLLTGPIIGGAVALTLMRRGKTHVPCQESNVQIARSP